MTISFQMCQYASKIARNSTERWNRRPCHCDVKSTPILPSLHSTGRSTTPVSRATCRPACSRTRLPPRVWTTPPSRIFSTARCYAMVSTRLDVRRSLASFRWSLLVSSGQFYMLKLRHRTWPDATPLSRFILLVTIFVQLRFYGVEINSSKLSQTQ